MSLIRTMNEDERMRISTQKIVLGRNRNGTLPGIIQWNSTFFEFRVKFEFLKLILETRLEKLDFSSKLEHYPKRIRNISLKLDISPKQIEILWGKLLMN